MIMPTKYLREDEALIGISASLLPLIEQDSSLSKLWDIARVTTKVGNYERFIFALDLLYLLGLITLNGNQIVRTRHDS